MNSSGMMTKLITSAHTAIFQWVTTCASSLPIGSLRPNPNEFRITKSTPNPLIRTLSDWSYRSLLTGDHPHQTPVHDHL